VLVALDFHSVELSRRRETMQGYQMPLAIALAVGIAATAYAQQSEPVVKLPDQIEWKAPPMVGGASTAILYGDPSKPGVYVTRTKFPAGLKTMPHTQRDPLLWPRRHVG